MSWLENLKAVKKDKDVSNKWISEQSGVPRKTVDRIFAGGTDSPQFDTIRLVCAALGVSIDDIASDTMTILGTKTVAILQTENDTLAAENEALKLNLEEVTNKNLKLREEICRLSAENATLALTLEHKEEIIAIHNYYIKKQNN